jgi:hypothetical protein
MFGLMPWSQRLGVNLGVNKDNKYLLALAFDWGE